MKQQKLEQLILLSLSLVLITAYSVSATLPQMMAFYQGYDESAVNLLISIPSFGVMLMVLLNLFFSRYLKERPCIITGLALFTVAATVPTYCSAYPVVLISRLLLGIGSGLVNAKAISVISLRYQGEERARLLGYRGSVESFGSALLALIAGFLLKGGWQKAYFVYFIGLPVLLAYVLFFRGRGTTDASPAADQAPRAKWERPALMAAIRLAMLGFLIISTYTVISMRLAGLFENRGYGTATEASIFISVMTCVSIVAGMGYGFVKKKLGDMLRILALLAGIAGLTLLFFSHSLVLSCIAVVLFAFTYTFINIGVFEGVAEAVPPAFIDRATSLVLTGCNLGAFLATYLISLAGLVSADVGASLLLMAVLMLVAAVILLIRRFLARRQA